MIKQITEKSLPHRFTFHLFPSPYRNMFFEIAGPKPPILEKHNGSLSDYLISIQQGKLPGGVFCFEVFEENKIFSIHYNSNEITEENVLKYAKSLNL